MLGKTQGSRKGGRSILKWNDSIKEATGVRVQELGRAGEDRTLWASLTSRGRTDSTALNT